MKGKDKEKIGQLLACTSRNTDQVHIEKSNGSANRGS